MVKTRQRVVKSKIPLNLNAWIIRSLLRRASFRVFSRISAEKCWRRRKKFRSVSKPMMSDGETPPHIIFENEQLSIILWIFFEIALRRSWLPLLLPFLAHLSTNGYQSCIKKPLHNLLQIPKSPVELRFLSDGDATLSTNAGRHLKLKHLYAR